MTKKLRKITKNFFGTSVLATILRYCLIFIFFVVIVSCLFWNILIDRFGYWFLDNEVYINPNFIFLFLICFCLIIFISLFCKKNIKIKKFLNSKLCFKITIIVGVLFLIWWEFIVLCNVLYISLADIDYITYFTLKGYFFPSSEEYLWMYPNLSFLMALFKKLLEFLLATNVIDILKNLFVFNGNYSEFMLICFIVKILTKILYMLGIIMIPFIVRKILNNAYAIFSYLLSIVFLGVSLQCTCPYSDAYGFFICTFILFIYFNVNNSYIKYSVICVSSIIGYLIKPTILVVFLSIFIVRIFILFKCSKPKKFTKNSLNLKKIKKIFCIVLFSAMCSVFVYACSMKLINNCFTLKPDKSITPEWYLMCGLNHDTFGLYSQEDRDIFTNIDGQDNKTQYVYSEIKNRLFSFTPKSFVKHYFIKTLILYNSGHFFIPASESQIVNEAIWNSFLDSFYRTNDGCWSYDNDIYVQWFNAQGDSVFCYLTKVLWLCILAFCIFAIFGKKHPKHIYIFALSIFILTTFVLLTEVSQRYLFINVTSFIVLSTVGVRCVINKIDARWKNRTTVFS